MSRDDAAPQPRRDESRGAERPGFIIDELIVDAMERAHALRCHGGIDLATVELVPLDADSVIETTERRWRVKYGSWTRRLNNAPPDPWWLVGWVCMGVSGETLLKIT